MSKDPAFPLFTQDFLVGTMFLTDAEVGVYMRLLCIQHQHGGIIDKETFNDKIKDFPRLKIKFIETEDGFYNNRLMLEMVKRQKKSNNLSANALKRWEIEKQKQCNCIAIVKPADNDNEIDNDIDVLNINIGIDFEIFWNAYDKKVGDKKKLKKKWDKLKEEEQAKALKHIELYKQSQPDKQYRKNPETYINNKSWNDEIIFKAKDGTIKPVVTESDLRRFSESIHNDDRFK